MSNTNIVVPHRYYPKLSEIIAVEDLPDFLSFVQDGLKGLLDNIHYKNLLFSKSYQGDSAFYSLDIVSRNIGLNLPFGLRLVLNPDTGGDSAISSFPVSLEYQWGVLAFLRSFNLQGFAFTPEAFYELGLRIFKISEDQVLAHTLNYFVDPDDLATDKFQQLLDDINKVFPNAQLSLPANTEADVATVASLIKQNAHISKSISGLLFSLYIFDANPSVIKQRLQEFYNKMVPGGLEDYVRDLVTPKAKAALQVSAGIEFPPEVLRPVTGQGAPLADPKKRSLFKFAEATLMVDTEAGIGFDGNPGGGLVDDYNEIGRTGLLLKIIDAKLDLSRNINIPEVDAAGYQADFVGLYIKEAEITFARFGKENRPAGQKLASIGVHDLIIGTGGVSGRLQLEAGGTLYRRFGGDKESTEDNFFAVELDQFALTFHQNAVIDSTIAGKLIISKFKDGNGQPVVIDITAAIQDNGDFRITAASGTGTLKKFNLAGVLEIEVRTLQVGQENGRYYAEISGALNLLADFNIPGTTLPKGIEIKQLRIYEDGHITFKPGHLDLPRDFNLKVGPVKMEVHKLSITADKGEHLGINAQGAQEMFPREYTCIGFDGMINLGSVGIKARGDGVKYYFTTDNNGTERPPHWYVSIEGIAIDITMPGFADEKDVAFYLQGMLKLSQPNENTPNAGREFSGDVSYRIPPLGNMSGAAALRLNPETPSFVVDIGVQFATPIQIGGGLSIYDFRGLIGYHYLAAKNEGQTWWDYYKNPAPAGITTEKMVSKPGVSLGAGASIATSFDAGYAFSSKVFVYLGVPSVFAIQGQAGILQSRLGLNDSKEPPFSALIVLDKTSFTGNLAVDYRPNAGSLISLQGMMEMAFFFNDATKWYINLGRDQPTSQRIQAQILQIFRGQAYFMLSLYGIKAGAGIRYDLNKSYGPVHLSMSAWIELGAKISFKPFQLGGYLNMGGSLEARVSKFSIGLSAAIGVSVEGPRPFNMIGFLEFKIRLLFFKVSFRVEVRLVKKDENVEALVANVPAIRLPERSNPKDQYMPAIAKNIQTEETFPINYIWHDFDGQASFTMPLLHQGEWAKPFDETIIPMDSYIDIELLKAVLPGNLLGGAGSQLPDGYFELVPPERGETEQARHEFSLSDLKIWAWNEGGNRWEPYHIYKAVPAIVKANEDDPSRLDNLKPGFWQFTDKNKYNKIRLLSRDAFSYVGQTALKGAALDALHFSAGDLFCADRLNLEVTVDWTDETPDKTYQPVALNDHQGLKLQFVGIQGSIGVMKAGKSGLRIEKALGVLSIRFPEPVHSVELQMGSLAHRTIAGFRKKTIHPLPFNKTRTTYEMQGSPLLIQAGRNDVRLSYNGDTELRTSGTQPIDEIQLLFDGRSEEMLSGPMQIGGHVSLPADTAGNLPQELHALELERSIANVALYRQPLTLDAVQGRSAMPVAASQWLLSNPYDQSGKHKGSLSGSPELLPAYYQQGNDSSLGLKKTYQFSAGSDALVIPDHAELRVESGSFSLETLVMFEPFTEGIATLIDKRSDAGDIQLQKGFTLHMIQQAQDAGTVFNSAGAVPQFSILLTCYDGESIWTKEAKSFYTTDCASGKIQGKQFKHIALSVNREQDLLEIFIDRQRCASVAVPVQLRPRTNEHAVSFIDSLTYTTAAAQQRAPDKQLVKTRLDEETVMLNNLLNRSIQPVWRPKTTFAVEVHTQDKVTRKDQSWEHKRVHVFGFRTAGPVGDFHKHNPAYAALAAQKLEGNFKLAGLKPYLDVDRSYPDALGRYQTSKPVYYEAPEIRLCFHADYINAMYANWDSYQGLPPVTSELLMELISPDQQRIAPRLVSVPKVEKSITPQNYRLLSPSQQMLYWFQNAGMARCGVQNPISFVKKLNYMTYQFEPLEPRRLYTTVISSKYNPGSGPQTTEIHKYTVQTSAFASFESHIKSVRTGGTDASPVYDVRIIDVSISAGEITKSIIPLLSVQSENDAAFVQRFSVNHDRVLFGGLGLKNLESSSRNYIGLLRNTDPASGMKRILGIVVVSPEPFNEPRYNDSLLEDTVRLTTDLGHGTTIDYRQYEYLHSGDHSSILITNAEMDLQLGKSTFTFGHKSFDGFDYVMVPEQIISLEIDLTQYLK